MYRIQLAIMALLLILIGSRQSSVAGETRVESPAAATPSLVFEANRGQTDGAVGFLARGPGYQLFLQPDQGTFALTNAPDQRHTARNTLRMRFLGASEDAAMAGDTPLCGHSHYLLGDDSDRWVRNVPQFGRVVCSGIYPGIDLVYYSQAGQLEYDLLVEPGADPAQIRILFQGADTIELGPDGDLVLRLGESDLLLRQPVAYQEDETHGRQAVDSHYSLKSDGSIGFVIGKYDRTKTLTIDPVLSYSTYLGGDPVGSQSATGIAVDGEGSMYVVGYTTALDFPVTVGAFQEEHGGAFFDVFVTKFDADGGLVYSTYLGGAGEELTFGVAVDASGHAYVTGRSTSTDFPTTVGVFQETSSSHDSFVLKLNLDGSDLVFSTYFGGDLGQDLSDAGIAVDADGNVIIAGTTTSSDLPTEVPFQDTLEGAWDGFIAKFNTDATALIYSTYIGGSGDSEACRRLAVDASGNAYITGWTDSTDFPTTTGAYQVTNEGGRDVFVAKFDVDGALVYSTYLGGGGYDIADGITADADGNAYVIGSTRSKDFPTTSGAYDTGFSKGNNIQEVFVCKVNSDGSDLVFSTFLGTKKSSGSGVAIALDASGNPVVCGYTGAADFPLVDELQTSIGGSNDVFVTTLDAAGSELLFSTFLGGAGHDQPRDVTTDSDGNIYVTGRTQSSDFPTTAGAFQAIKGTGEQGFVTRISGDPPPVFGTVSGTVTDADDSSPILGALVESDSAESTLTLSDGSYSFDVLVGDRTVTVSASGFDSQDRGVTVTESATTTEDFALDASTSGGSSSVQCITYDTSGGRSGDKHLHITVRIVDGSGSPLAGASVTVDVSLDGPFLESFSGTTNASGDISATIGNADAGVYSCDVTDLDGVDPSEPANSHDKGSDTVPDADCVVP